MVKSKNRKTASILPVYIFELAFVLLPVIYAVFLSFTTRTDTWQINPDLSFKNYIEIFNPVYLPALGQSFKLAFFTTIICIVLGYPAGIAISRIDKKWQNFFLKAHMLPFFINSLIRICGLIILLRTNGLIDTLLMRAGIIDQSLRLLYSFPAVVSGMVYVLLPMMIYSVYSSASKLKPMELEAARVMGANPVQAFFDVTLPLTAGGLLTGTTLCFIPSMGLYIISSLLGGGKTVLISNVIEDQFMKVHNLPFAAALAVMLMILTAFFAALFKSLDPVQRKIRRAEREASYES